jgi:hypothetical protein
MISYSLYKDEILAYFMVPSYKLSGETKKNHEKPHVRTRDLSISKQMQPTGHAFLRKVLRGALRSGVTCPRGHAQGWILLIRIHFQLDHLKPC